MKKLVLALLLLTSPAFGQGASVNIQCKTGGNPPWGFCDASNPLPVGAVWTTKLLSGLTNTAIAVKATSGSVGKVYCYNPNVSVAYIQIFNLAAASVSVGSTIPQQSYGIPATNASGFSFPSSGDGYSTAISVAATTAATGGTAPGTALDCNISYN